MPYCSLEEAWGPNYQSPDYFEKANKHSTPPPIHSRSPPEMTQDGLMNTHQLPKPSENIPSYSGGAPVNPAISSTKSNIVPYKVKFPENSKRNYLQSPDFSIQDEEDYTLDELEDNDRDMRHIDTQRRVKPEYEPDYLTSEDYFLYKKYLNLAEKYKERLRKKYKNFIDENEDNKNILENFSNIYQDNNTNENYSMRDIFIIIVVGIFLIFSLDIFVKMGSKFKK